MNDAAPGAGYALGSKCKRRLGACGAIQTVGRSP